MNLTPNQIVARNLRRARRVMDLTQEEFGQRLAPHLGRPWSTATVCAAENSWRTSRSRKFDADEITAFSRVLGVGIDYFFKETP